MHRPVLRILVGIATVVGSTLWASAAPSHASAATGTVSAPARSGYWLATSNGGVSGFQSGSYGSATGLHLTQPIVGAAAAPGGNGYWLAAADGGVFGYGPAAHFYGSMGGTKLTKPIVGIAADPATGGYWLVASDGGVFAFNAPFFGSMGGTRLNKPVVAMAATPDGQGYWLVASDGGIFTFGTSARFFGSTGALRLVQPVVGMAIDAATGGYWLVAADGGVFAFNAAFYGSAGRAHLSQPVVGITPSVDGRGYWIATKSGQVFNYGSSAPSLGSAVGVDPTHPVVAITALPPPAWSVESLPAVPANSMLTSISCPTSDGCVAVGSVGPVGSPVAQPFALIHSAQGGWVVDSPTLPAADSGGGLSAVSCSGPTFCMAVGTFASGGSKSTLAEIWNGSTWSQVTGFTPNASAALAFFSVSCTSATWCVALGRSGSQSSPDQKQLIEQWDGQAWTQMPYSQLATGEDDMFVGSVSCTGPAFCFAVGTVQGVSRFVSPFDETWDGSSWSNPLLWGDGHDSLSGTSCISTVFCEVVGLSSVRSYAAERDTAETIGLMQQALPFPEGRGLSGVSCVTADECHAIGTIRYTWNGAGWYEEPSGPVVPGSSGLNDISCAAAGACTAIGERSSGPYIETVGP